MHSIGSIVTLAVTKSHGDSPETAISVRRGICGQVVSNGRNVSGNHSYVVDFGPEGQWNCVHSEVEGTQPDPDEGWDGNDRAYPYAEEAGSSEGYDLDDDSEEDEDDSYEIRWEPDQSSPVPNKNDLTGDIEKDIAKRIKELEKEKGIK